VNNTSLPMPPNLFRLLRALSSRPNVEMDAEELFDRIWPDSQKPEDPSNSLFRLASRVRAILTKNGFDGEAILPKLNKARSMFCGRIRPVVVVLLVDDQVEKLRAFEGAVRNLSLAEHDLHVMTASGYEQACQKMARHLPDILVTDLYFGAGPDNGYSLAAKALDLGLRWVLVLSTEVQAHRTPSGALGSDSFDLDLASVVRIIVEARDEEQAVALLQQRGLVPGSR